MNSDLTNNAPVQMTVVSSGQIQVSEELRSSIAAFSPVMATYLSNLGLPTANVLAPVDERRKVIDSLASALEIIPLQERERSFYLTRFAVAVTVGLFDGALSYLWDEAIKALRRLVARFDLGYFFSVAEKISSRNKNYHTEDDLNGVDDHDLLEACRRIGLLSDVNHRRLEHVNYMRNHASAAHPNENEIDGHEMVGWLSNCLRHAIIAEPEHSVIKVKMFLENIRTQSIPAADIPTIGADVVRLGAERVDDFLWTLFGIYVDPRQSAEARSNIQLLAPFVWSVASEDRKYELGAKYGTFRKNGDTQRKDAAGAFLAVVGGNNYKDEDSLAGELLERLGALKSAHYGMNNFYNEYAHAKILGESLPANGVIPRAARATWVKIITICFVGNGQGFREGVDEGALTYYKSYIERFTEAEIITFLHLFGDQEFILAFDRLKCDTRLRALIRELRNKTTNVLIHRALDILLRAPVRTLDRVSNVTEYQQALTTIPVPT